MKQKHGRITAYIHLDAAAQNFQQMRTRLREGVQMVAVVKTDAYGHGAVQIARMAEPYDDLWGFAVAAVEEGRELREAGIQKPILVLGYTFQEDYEELIRLGLRPAVFTLQMAEELSEAAERLGVTAPVHLAVDTGMSRIGFSDREEGLLEAEAVCRVPHLQMEGAFTHFARADELDKTSARGQLQRFQDFCGKLKQRTGLEFLCHCSNSAGILELPEANLDLVRAGITIYGIYPSDEMSREFPLCPVMELKSHIVHLKTIPAGTPVSYGGTFVADRAMRVATIPVGYGDGYPRSLSGCGEVLIRGRRAKILGRICMDQFMVDVTGLSAELLDEVTLLGRDGTEEITIDELGVRSGRFPYEFVCSIGRRVPRRYV